MAQLGFQVRGKLALARKYNSRDLFLSGSQNHCCHKDWFGFWFKIDLPFSPHNGRMAQFQYDQTHPFQILRTLRKWKTGGISVVAACSRTRIDRSLCARYRRQADSSGLWAGAIVIQGLPSPALQLFCFEEILCGPLVWLWSKDYRRP